MKRNTRSTALFIIIILVGLIIGGVLGQALGKYAPFLSYGDRIGLSTTTIDLGFANITFGFDLHLNLAGALGLLIAIILYQRM